MPLIACPNVALAWASSLRMMLMQELSLASCSRANDWTLMQLLPYLPNLTSLNLNDCEGLTDASMAAVSACLPRLASLGVQHCPSITPACLPYLATLPCLRSLDFCGSGLEVHPLRSEIPAGQSWQHLTSSPPRNRPWWMNHSAAVQDVHAGASSARPSSEGDLLDVPDLSSLSGHVPDSLLHASGAGPSQNPYRGTNAALPVGFAAGQSLGNAMGGQPGLAAPTKPDAGPAGESAASALQLDTDMECGDVSYSSSRSSMSAESLPDICPNLDSSWQCFSSTGQ